MNLADKHNAAAMREALKTVKRYLDGYTVNVPENMIHGGEGK